MLWCTRRPASPAVLKRLKDAGAKMDDPMTLIGTSRTTPLLGAFKFGDTDVARTLFQEAFAAADIVLASSEDLLPLYPGMSNETLLAQIPGAPGN